MFKSVPITLITGYLGSGKTTLLNNILNNKDNLKIAVIVNDIGEVNIDASLIEKGGVVNSKDESLVPLQNGCICCNLKTDLLNQINDLLEMKKFDHIIIEASGICEPIPIAQTLQAVEDAYLQYKMPRLCYLDSIISVVDAKRLSAEFNDGESLTKENIEDDDLEKLVIQQIEFCNTIILNKIDEVSKDELNKIKTIIKALQPNANIIETNYSKVDLKEILDTHKFSFEKAATSSGWYEALENEEDEDESGEVLEYGISTFVYERRKPFNREKFVNFVENFPKGVIRSKGILYFDEDERMSFMFESSGVLKDLYEAGLWLIEEEPSFQKEVLAQNPDLQKDWDPEYGDKMVKLVFIGQHMDKESIIKELNQI